MTQAIGFHETGGPDVLKFEDVEVGAPGRGSCSRRGDRPQPRRGDVSL